MLALVGRRVRRRVSASFGALGNSVARPNPLLGIGSTSTLFLDQHLQCRCLSNGVSSDGKPTPRRERRRSIFEAPKTKKDQTERSSLFEARSNTATTTHVRQEGTGKSLFEPRDATKVSAPAGSGGQKQAKSSLFEPKAPKASMFDGRKEDLSSIQLQLSSLEDLAARLKSVPLSLSESTIRNVDLAERKELFRSAKDILESLRMAVDQKKINPSGKHGRVLSSVLGRILGIYTATYHDDPDYSIFEECLWVLVLLDDWNLNRQEAHYQNAIVVGVQEHRWKHAAELFRQQIDRDASGFCPMSFVSVSSPVGLYAIARDAQESGKNVVEAVMEAVTSLSLISPTDKDRYILAAGTAIGLAGEWEGLVSHLKESSDAGTPDQPLVAAAMNACLLCNQHKQASELFRTLTDGNLAISSEFHWGGGQDSTFPLCRDLAMRTLAQSGSGSEAMTMLRQALDEELAISEEALNGVFSALERDEDWRDAVDLLFDLWKPETKLIIVPGAELDIPSVFDVQSTDEAKQSLIDDGRILSCVMGACNKAGEFGAALLCFMLVDINTRSSRGSMVHDESAGAMAMLGLLGEVKNANELLSAAMVALCGVESFEQAQILFDLAMEHATELDQTSDAFVEAEQLYQYALACADSTPEQRRWATCHRHADRILRALDAIKSKGEQLEPDQIFILGSALATLLKACTGANQPAAGLLLSDFVTSELAKFAPKDSGSHFTLGDKEKEKTDDTFTVIDTFLAEKMKAHLAMDQKAHALSLLSSNVDSFEREPERWTHTTNAVLKILSESGNTEEATSLFQRHVQNSRGDSIDSFVTAAQIFADARRWNDVIDTYHMALEKGCHSSPLGLLSMKAVSESKLAGKLRIARGIIRDTSKAAGTDPASWLDARYWSLKRLLGFSDARLLMWWNEPNESPLDELDFAIESFEKRVEEGRQVKKLALRLIVSHARHFNGAETLEEGKHRRIPRDQSGWADLVKRVVSESTNLRNDVRYLDEASAALRHLGCHVECLNLVEAAVKRNVQVGDIAAREALLAEEALGLDHAQEEGNPQPDGQ